MISSTHLTQSPLTPQATRSAANANITPTPANGAYAHSDRVQFGDSAAKPSAWERFKQGVARLWQSFIAPFKRLLSWFKTPQAKPNANTKPSPAAPASKSTDPAGAQNPTETTPAAESHPIAPVQSGTPQGSLQPAALPASPPKPSRTSKSRRPSSGQHTKWDGSPNPTDHKPAIFANPANPTLRARSPKKASQKSSEQNIPARVRPAGASSRPVAATPSLPRALSVEELFGSNLTSIQFQQGGANTCYLLSALDAIFHHPQGRKILDLIQINRTENGYMVKFPGHDHPIPVANKDLNHYCKSETPGVSLLELAYLKLPDALHPSEYDSTTAALTLMFGQNRIQQTSFAETSMIASAQESPIIDEFADIWTAVHRVKDEAGNPIDAGKHYFSIRLNPNEPNQIELANPYHTERVERKLSLGELEADYLPELSRIRLNA